MPLSVLLRKTANMTNTPRPEAGGFRALGVNYWSYSGVDPVGINETLYGPVIGISYRF